MRPQVFAFAVTLSVPVVAFSKIVAKAGATVKLQAGLSVMENVAVPIVIVALRFALVGLGSTV